MIEQNSHGELQAAGRPFFRLRVRVASRISFGTATRPFPDNYRDGDYDGYDGLLSIFSVEMADVVVGVCSLGRIDGEVKSGPNGVGWKEELR